VAIAFEQDFRVTEMQLSRAEDKVLRLARDGAGAGTVPGGLTWRAR
jgi:hypothetical protein